MILWFNLYKILEFDWNNKYSHFCCSKREASRAILERWSTRSTVPFCHSFSSAIIHNLSNVSYNLLCCRYQTVETEIKIRAGDAGLGNRRPNHLGQMYKECPWCSAMGIRVLLNELHVILECPGSGHARRATGIYAFLKARLPLMTERAILIEFLGGGMVRTLKQWC